MQLIEVHLRAILQSMEKLRKGATPLFNDKTKQKVHANLNPLWCLLFIFSMECKYVVNVARLQSDVGGVN